MYVCVSGYVLDSTFLRTSHAAPGVGAYFPLPCSLPVAGAPPASCCLVGPGPPGRVQGLLGGGGPRVSGSLAGCRQSLRAHRQGFSTMDPGWLLSEALLSSFLSGYPDCPSSGPPGALILWMSGSRVSLMPASCPGRQGYGSLYVLFSPFSYPFLGHVCCDCNNSI